MSDQDPIDPNDPNQQQQYYDDDGRGELLQRDGILLIVVILSLSNGMHFSPLFDYVLFPIMQLTRGLLMDLPLLVTYITSLLLSTVTLMLSGIPAALYERKTGRTETDAKVCVIWAVTALVLSLPSVLTFLQII